jgi:DNA-binding NarL/FixJ family response regulator
LKDCEPEDLEKALLAVAAGGEAYPSPDPNGLSSPAPGAGLRRERLTPRETEVLTLVAEGLSNRGIAEQLGISPRTVEAHRRVITQKL